MATPNNPKGAKPAPSTPTAPIMDVAKPGTSAPSPTSKSIILNHRPRVADPMVTAGQSDAGDTIPVKTDAKPKLAPTAQPVIEPLAEAGAAPETLESAKEGPKTADAPSTEPEKPAEIADSATGPGAAASSAEAPKIDETVDGDDTKTSTDKPDPSAIDEAEAAKQAEHDDALQKLVDSKQYVLPINAVEHRRSRQVLILGVVVSVVLVVAWADVALDAGLIQISGVKPVTHFFSN